MDDHNKELLQCYEVSENHYQSCCGNCFTGNPSAMVQPSSNEFLAAIGGIQIGNVSTLPTGSQATVTNSGSPYYPILNFGIPQGNPEIKGDTGATGNPGSIGPAGEMGPKGDTGPSGERGQRMD